MKRTLLAMLALTVFAGSAAAADMPRKIAYQAPGPYQWSGLYLGVHGGTLFASSSTTTDIFGLITAYDSASSGGFVGGGQMGYLFQSGPIVYGAELGASLTSIDLKSTDGIGITKQIKHPWEVSLVGRLGYAADRTLFSVYGGAVRGKFTVDEDIFGFGSDSASISRWAPRVGARVDYAMTRNWSAALSLDYTKWGSFDHQNANLGVVSSYKYDEIRALARIDYHF